MGFTPNDSLWLTTKAGDLYYSAGSQDVEKFGQVGVVCVVVEGCVSVYVCGVGVGVGVGCLTTKAGDLYYSAGLQDVERFGRWARGMVCVCGGGVVGGGGGLGPGMRRGLGRCVLLLRRVPSAPPAVLRRSCCATFRAVLRCAAPAVPLLLRRMVISALPAVLRCALAGGAAVPGVRHSGRGLPQQECWLRLRRQRLAVQDRCAWMTTSFI